MANLLCLDSSTDACTASLVLDNDEVISRWQLTPRQQVNHMLPMIEGLLQEAKLVLSDIDAIAFGCGPGSFTGIRISVSIMQGLAITIQCACLPISSLNIIAQGAYREHGANQVLVVVDAKMGEVYSGRYALGQDQLMQPVLPDCLCKPEAISLPEDGSWLMVGDAPLPKFDQSHVRGLSDPIYPHAKDLAVLARQGYQTGKGVPLEDALPAYLRGKEAWKKA